MILINLIWLYFSKIKNFFTKYLVSVLVLTVLLLPSNLFAEDGIFQTTNYAEFLSELWSISLLVIISFSSIVILGGLILYIFGSTNKNNEALGKGLIQGGLLSLISIFFVRNIYSSLSKTVVKNDNQDISGLIATLNKIIVLISSFSYTIGVLVILYSGYLYLSSGGDSDKIQQARKSFEYGVIGLVGILFLQSIVKWVINFMS